MSVEAQAIALNHSRAKSPIQKLVLIGIANHDGDGGAYPAVATLARYACCSPRAVQQAVDQLERLGEVRRHVQEGGDRHVADYARPNLYEFLLRCPPDCDRTKNHRTRRQQSVQPDLDGLDAPIGYPPVDKPGAPRSPGARGAGGPGAPRSPKPVHLEPTNSRSVEPVQTARTHESWTHPCIDGTSHHQRSRKTGACAFCAATTVTWSESD